MDFFFNQLSLAAPTGFILSIIVGFLLSRYSSVGKSISFGLVLLIILGLFYGLINVYYTNSICATLDGSPCTLTQQEILSNVLQNVSSILFPYGLLIISPGFIGLLIGSLFGKVFHKRVVV